MKEFNAAPKEITRQYPLANIDALHETIHQIEEDPQLVADCIIDQLTIFSPVLNNYPGIGSKVINWSMWLSPQPVKSFMEVLGVLGKNYGPYPEIVKNYQETSSEQK